MAHWAGLSFVRLNKSRGIKRFHRVALQRFGDARLLFEGGRNTAAIYLAGYAVECGLKALLLSSATASECQAIVDSFRGFDGHNLKTLKARYIERSRVSFPKSVAGRLTYVNLWTTSLRYEPANASPREAKEFLGATGEIIEWIEGRL